LLIWGEAQTWGPHQTCRKYNKSGEEGRQPFIFGNIWIGEQSPGKLPLVTMQRGELSSLFYLKENKHCYIILIYLRVIAIMTISNCISGSIWPRASGRDMPLQASHVR